MTGGVGSDEVRNFYSTYFLPGHPLDTQTLAVARTVGEDRIVDELIHKFTHTMEMPWLLPGVPPTGKRVEIAVIVVVQFEDGKIAGERIYWDQASVLAQVGLIDADQLPVTGIEASRKVVDPAHAPSNSLIKRASR
jgi:carboxymethylenebutenolidase